MGDKVQIRTRPTISVKDYKIGQDLVYDQPTSDAVSLNIDQGRYFGFKVNDVDAYQSDIDLMDEFTNDASEQMQISIDTSILGDVYADVAAENTGASAGAISGSYALGASGSAVKLTGKESPASGEQNIINWIVNLGSVLDEQNVPQTGRWLVLPPWACGLIKNLIWPMRPLPVTTRPLSAMAKRA